MARIDHEDLLTWLPIVANQGAVVASLPDAAELGISLPAWRSWFEEAAAACFRASSGPTIFKVTDRLAGGEWISKAELVMDAAADASKPLLWHKIALRRLVGSTDLHRPTYSHLLCFGPGRPGRRTADVIDGGPTLWRNGIGVYAARLIAHYLADVGVQRMLNPGCGHGTLLTAAEAAGIEAWGCDLDAHQVEVARGRLAQGTLGFEALVEEAISAEYEWAAG